MKHFNHFIEIYFGLISNVIEILFCFDFRLPKVLGTYLRKTFKCYKQRFVILLYIYLKGL